MNPDVPATRKYYSSLSPSDLCSCDYCKCYRHQIRKAYPQIADYLHHLGADIEKPFETSPLEPDPEGFLEYCGCQYIVFGSCPPDYSFRLSDITLRVTTRHPHTGLDLPHFVLEFYPIKLKFLPSS